MARRKRMKPHLQALHNQRMASHEILCEECGRIYDQHTGQGLCGSCAGDDAHKQGKEDAGR